MNNMIMWSLPILFMLHDFEEIIIVNVWQTRYAEPLCQSTIQPFAHWCSTASGAIAVLIEFCLLTTATMIATITGNHLVWFAFYSVLIAHYFIHFYYSIRFRHYTPGLLTSLVFLPLSLVLVMRSGVLQVFSAKILIITCLLALPVFVVFFKWLTSNIKTFEMWLKRYAVRQVR